MVKLPVGTQPQWEETEEGRNILHADLSDDEMDGDTDALKSIPEVRS